MAVAGDHYSVILKKSHIDWGGYRHTDTRPKIAGEAYVPIPRDHAQFLQIYKGDLFTAVFADGFPSFQARAAGNSAAGDVFAKQFQGDGDLKAFGRWYTSCGAEVGDRVKVKFLSPDTVQFELVKAVTDTAE